MVQLLAPDELPAGFHYPPLFLKIVKLGLTALKPWWILDGDWIRERWQDLGSRYPDRHLLPFAERQGLEEFACWDLDRGDIVRIHLASPGWEQRERFPSFAWWLRQAIEDLVEFEGSELHRKIERQPKS